MSLDYNRIQTYIGKIILQLLLLLKVKLQAYS